MRRDDVILQSLRGADCIISRASRTGGPRGFKSALADRGGSADFGVDQIENAIEQMQAIAAIDDARVRRLVAVAANTHGCKCMKNIREIAAEVGISKSTAQRLLNEGLAQVRRYFEGVDFEPLSPWDKSVQM